MPSFHPDVQGQFAKIRQMNLLTSHTVLLQGQWIISPNSHQFVVSASVVKIGHEINSDFQIGCMIAGTPTYPLTSNPDDVIAAMNKDREIYFFADVHVRGYYPSYMDRYFKENHIDIHITEEDRNILKNTVYFISFSYYMSNCATVNLGDIEQSKGNIMNIIKNPYLSESEWGWPVDPKA